MIQKLLQNSFILGEVTGSYFIHSFSQNPNLEIINKLDEQAKVDYLLKIMEINKEINPEIQFFRVSSEQELDNLLQTIEDRKEFFNDNFKRLVVIIDELPLTKKLRNILENIHINCFISIGVIYFSKRNPIKRKPSYLNKVYTLENFNNETILSFEELELIIR